MGQRDLDTLRYELLKSFPVDRKDTARFQVLSDYDDVGHAFKEEVVPFDWDQVDLDVWLDLWDYYDRLNLVAAAYYLPSLVLSSLEHPGSYGLINTAVTQINYLAKACDKSAGTELAMTQEQYDLLIKIRSILLDDTA